MTEKEIRNKFGKIIKEARELRGLSLRALGEETGISYAHLSRIENGESTPERKTVEVLSKSLNLNMNYLLIASGYAPFEVDLEAATLINEIWGNYYSDYINSNDIEDSKGKDGEGFQEIETNIVKGGSPYEDKEEDAISEYYLKFLSNLRVNSIKIEESDKGNIERIKISSEWIQFIKDMEYKKVKPRDLQNILSFIKQMRSGLDRIKYR